MTIEQKLMEQAGMIMQERGHASVDLARRSVLGEEVEQASLREALHYFIEGWNDFLHPALISLACDAVGGKLETTVELGAALVLLAGGADIHDDVIDESVIKGSEQTVFGKFGKDLAILTGDALLLEGVYLLHEGCEKLGESKRKTILNIVKQGFLEISGAEAAEASMRGRTNIPKQQYVDIIRHKVAAGEIAMRMGALVGDGTPKEVEALAEFGRVYGVLMSLRDEFIDVFEQEELSHRLEKEVLPLPIILAFADESRKSALMQLLRGKITEDKIEQIVDLATNNVESKFLVSEMKKMVDQLILRIQNLRYCRENLELLASATLEDL